MPQPPAQPATPPGPTGQAGKAPLIGHPVMDSLDEEPTAEREAMILEAVRAGRLDPVGWRFVVSRGRQGSDLEGYAVAVPVMADALKFGGVRFATNYRTAQYIADALGLQLMTPYMDALAYEQAEVRPGYTAPQPVSATKSAMLHTSRLVDEKVKAAAEQAGVPHAEPFAANVGKNWVLTRIFWEPGVHPVSHVPHAVAAANHGLYLSAWHPIQNVGVAHNLEHVDSTQVLRFMGDQSELSSPDGTQQYRATKELLTDARFAPLLTGERGVLRGIQVGEGPLPAARHPALPELGIAV